jgi:hypothetical protein
MAPFSPGLGVKWTTLCDGIVTARRERMLMVRRVRRRRTEKVPNPVTVTVCPRRRAASTASKTVERIRLAR